MLKQRIIINTHGGNENNNDVDIRNIVAAVESQGKQSTIRTCWRTVSKLSQCQNCIICEKSGCFNNLAELRSVSQDLLPHWCEIFFFADSSSILALFRTFKKSDVFARILKQNNNEFCNFTHHILRHFPFLGSSTCSFMLSFIYVNMYVIYCNICTKIAP